MAQSESMVHARSELARKMSEKPTRVATDELQLHDRVNADAACPVQNHTRPVMSADTADVPIPSTEPSSGIEATAPIVRPCACLCSFYGLASVYSRERERKVEPRQRHLLNCATL